MINKQDQAKIKLEKGGLTFPITVNKYLLFLHLSKKKENKKRTYNIAWDAFQIYNHLIFTGIMQDTNQPWANNSYLIQGLSLTEERIKQAKKLLKEINLIEISEQSKEKGKFTKKYTKILTSDPLSTQNKDDSVPGLNGIRNEPDMAQTGINALSNNINALSNKKDIIINNNISVSKETQKNFNLEISPYGNNKEIEWLPELLLKGLFKPRLNKKTKTMDRVLNYIKQIQSHRFIRSDFNKEWFEKNKIKKAIQKIKEIENIDDLQKVLKRALFRFGKMKGNKEYWPADKKYLKNLSVADFFYNKINKKSWFLYCLCNKSTLLKSATDKNKIDKQKEYLEKKYKIKVTLFPKIIYNNNSTLKKWNNENWVIFNNTIRKMCEWHEDNIDAWKIMNDNYGSYLRTPEQFLKLIGDFLQDVFPDPKPNFMNNTGRIYSIFAEWAEEERGLNINPDKKDVQKQRKWLKEKREMDYENKINERIEELTMVFQEHRIDLPDYEILRQNAIEDLRI